jgi:hypothetical protein
MHVPVPGQEPPTTLQPVNADPAFGVAVKVTITPSNGATQVLGHNIPVGDEVTVPLPVPAGMTVTCDGTIVQLSVKGALTFAEASTASTDQVCAPSLRPEYVTPGTHVV